MDFEVVPTDANLESQESEIPSAFHPPELGADPDPSPFLCPYCPMTCRLKSHLNDHVKVHNQDKMHACPLCDKVWTNLYKLNKHLRSHTGEKHFKCPADGCGKEFANRHTLKSHLRIHTEEKMGPKPTCAICGTSFIDMRSLKHHNWKFHNAQKKKHPCVTCGKVYVSLFELNRHLGTHLPDDPQNCPTCGKSCRNGHALKKHMQRHGLEGTYKCEQCAKNFKANTYLQIHIRTVHGGQKYNGNKNHVCSFCGRKLLSPSQLAIHLRTHTGETPFKCTTCSKAFATKVKLQRHLKVHTGEKPEECQFCGQRFARKSVLARHIRTHTGETPYKCDKCGKAFGDLSTMKRHRLAVHREDRREEDRQTPAHIPEDAQDPLHIPSENNCSAKLDLQVGPADANPETQESETPVAFHPPEMGAASTSRRFLCPHCPKTYRLQIYLNEHIKIHNPDNPHVCPFCTKVFPNDNHLTRHVRSHTGEKLFRCSADGCGKEFTRPRALGLHMRIHTGEKMDNPLMNRGNDPQTQVPEPSCELHIDKGCYLRLFTITVQRMKFKIVGGGVLELRSEGACWYVCGKCGRGSKSILIRSHALRCQVRQSNPIN